MRRYALGAAAGCAAAAAGFAAIHLMEPSPATGPRVAEEVEKTDNGYTAAAIADWERVAEQAADLALLASPGVREASRTREERELVVGRGDTMMRLLLRADVPRNQAAAAIAAMRKVTIRVGSFPVRSWP